MTSDQDVTKLTAERVVTRFDRRTFVRRGVDLGAGLAGAGALVRFGTAAQAGSSTPATAEASPSSSSTVQTATPKIVAATNAFLKTLSASERSAVSFDWTDTAQKHRWSNLPQGAFQRSGLMWGDLNATTQNAWLKVMQATLSSEGYNRVIAEWKADDVLAAQQGG